MFKRKKAKEGSKLEVGNVEVDLDNENGVAIAVKESQSELKEEKEIEREAPAVRVSSSEPKKGGVDSVKFVKKKRHKENVSALFAEIERKKKMSKGK